MPSRYLRTLPLWIASIAFLSWGCSSDDRSPVGPNGSPELSATATATYTIHSLGFRGEALGINDAGVVVGESRGHAFRWQNGVFKDLGTIVGGTQSAANDINNNGVIVGWSLNSAGDTRAIRWAPDGKKRSLGTLGGRNSEATAINDFGVIVGWSETLSGQRHAFRWENGVMTDLGTMGGAWSIAYDINRGGAIVGYSQVPSGERHAFKWKTGVFKDLGTRSGGYEGQFSIATAVNTKGQIAGILGPPLDALGEEEDFTVGFLFYQDVMTTCCRFRRPTTEVEDINPNGIIVGMEEDLRGAEPTDNEDAWVYENGTTARLPELSEGHSGAKAINLAGTIAGFSQTAAGQIRAVIWRRQ
jgi:probable HAF family extracellular repeat protein